jgi:hypothetical protein
MLTTITLKWPVSSLPYKLVVNPHLLAWDSVDHLTVHDLAFTPPRTKTQTDGHMLLPLVHRIEDQSIPSNLLCNPQHSALAARKSLSVRHNLYMLLDQLRSHHLEVHLG